MSRRMMMVTVGTGGGGSGGFYVPLTIDHTKCGSADSADFPVLVDITDANFKTVANGGHVDNTAGVNSIRFYSDSGLTTLLKFERELYTPAGGRVLAWVKLPTLSHTSDTVFYMKYGAPGDTSDVSDAANTWDSSFSAVYHLGDGSTLSLADSTSNANTLAQRGGGFPNTAAGTGQVYGGAVEVNANNSDLAALDAGSLQMTTFTVEGWYKPASLPATVRIFMIKGDGAVINYALGTSAASKAHSVFSNSTGGNYNAADGATTLSTGTWYYIVATYDGTTHQIYLNGSQDGTLTTSNTPDNNGQLHIGLLPASNPLNGDGTVDEIRVSKNIARSASWILSSYNNQNSPSTFLSVGGEVAL